MKYKIFRTFTYDFEGVNDGEFIRKLDPAFSKVFDCSSGLSKMRKNNLKLHEMLFWRVGIGICDID